MVYPIRLNKYLRDQGLASRREADKLVDGGLVFVNGKRAESGTMVREGDKVLVKGQQKQYQYLAYYKPKGLATQDLPGKESVITKWKSKGLYPIGRLDKDSEGLLILTNDGRLVREMLSKKLPILSAHHSDLQNRGSSISRPNKNLEEIGTKYEKEYIVTVREPVRASIPAIFKKGMQTKSLGKLLPAKATIMSKTKLRIILNEGKRRQIRVMLNELHLTIVSLKRVRIGDIKLGDMKPGETRPVRGIANDLHHQSGVKDGT